jgi:hypothetical protein
LHFLCSFAALQLCSFAALQLCSFAALQLCSFAALQLCSFAALHFLLNKKGCYVNIFYVFAALLLSCRFSFLVPRVLSSFSRFLALLSVKALPFSRFLALLSVKAFCRFLVFTPSRLLLLLLA